MKKRKLKDKIAELTAIKNSLRSDNEKMLSAIRERDQIICKLREELEEKNITIKTMMNI